MSCSINPACYIPVPIDLPTKRVMNITIGNPYTINKHKIYCSSIRTNNLCRRRICRDNGAMNAPVIANMITRISTTIVVSGYENRKRAITD